ncbi:MAG: type II toxin-antitoxin system HicB family antitoxin [Deltaproteobacteria bacterium]|nr:type II toxin-antitoxin system HicB family antitoxin [Deltaproteobacteria bacterium]
MKKHTVKAYLYKGEAQYVAECVEIPVVTQGKTLDETLKNLQEAVSLHLDGEDLKALGFIEDPNILITMEIETSRYAA